MGNIQWSMNLVKLVRLNAWFIACVLYCNGNIHQQCFSYASINNWRTVIWPIGYCESISYKSIIALHPSHSTAHKLWSRQESGTKKGGAPYHSMHRFRHLVPMFFHSCMLNWHVEQLGTLPFPPFLGTITKNVFCNDVYLMHLSLTRCIHL